jgi:formamidopyrimidine-DNA glycosylase
MPELPDVETMRQYLQATSLHQEIADVEVRAAGLLPDGDVIDRTTAEALNEALVGRTLASTSRHGKYLLVDLDEGAGEILVLHFGMSGDLSYFKDMADEPEYDRVLVHFANGYHLAYEAVRKLGEVAVIDDVDRFVAEKELGPDALDPAFDLEAFKEAVAGRRMMVKSFLMDQQTLAGIGNVYSDEILFQAGIHPRTKINTLDEEAVEALFHTMKDVLQTAIDYQSSPEQYPDSFLTSHRHEGGTCPRCGADLERVKVSSRSAYFCPNRQTQRTP